VAGSTGVLSAYVPLLLREWLVDHPDRRCRAVPGSIAFVDISGFTRLSESLARRGKIGAEELTDAINSSFTDLLRVAYAEGGSLLKFGGDALLLLFTGDDHPARTARAAVGMRSALRGIGAFDTPDGRVTLRMSIGAHSGTYHFFLVGESHRELIITGSCATETVRMEATADAGEIVVSSGMAARLPSSVLGAAKGAGALLAASPSGEIGAVPFAPLPTDATLEAAIPVALREVARADRTAAEHRKVTVAFVRFQHADGLIEEWGAESTGDELHRLVVDIQRAADRHSVAFLGTDIDSDGGKIILAAGAPTSTENDEDRMLLALREITERERVVPIHIGVHRGNVFAGEIGPSYRRAYTVMGDAVNLAARLMGKAAPGEILSTPEVLAACRTRFETTALEPFTVKGKSEPVRAHRVGGAVGTSADAPGNDLPFVGRADEIVRFDEVLVAAQNGSGRLVALVGEAGIGKSRLLDVLVERAQDRVDAHRVRCELYRSSTPYSPFRSLLRGLLGMDDDTGGDEVARTLSAFVEDHVPELIPWLPLLAVPFDTEIDDTPEAASLDARFRRPRMHAAVLDLLDHLWPGPTLLTIDDAHWMDDASADLLAYLVEEVSAVPWIVCVARQGSVEGFDVGDAEDGVVLPLGPLDEWSAMELAKAATESAPLPQHALDVLVERSGGSPLFLLELASLAREAGGVGGLPDSIGSLVTARIDELPHDDRMVLRHLSVLGRTFDADMARWVLADTTVLEEVLAGRRLSAFLDRDGRELSFRHMLLRDAAYEGLPYRLRRELHASVGDRIVGDAGSDADEHAELLSFHFLLAARFADAWRYSLRAAEDAAEIYANEDAARFYRRAMEAGAELADVSDADRARVSEALGDVLQRMGDFPRASAAYAVTQELHEGDDLSEARILLKQAMVQSWLERIPDAVSSLHAGLDLLGIDAGAEAQRLRAQLMAWYGHFSQKQGRHEEAIDWSRRAIEVAEIAGEKDALAHAYKVLDWTYADMGEPENAIYSERALALYEELDDLANQGDVLNNMGGIAYWLGRWREARELYERGHELDLRTGDAHGAAFGSNNIAEILADQGHLEEAERLFREVERAWRAAGDVGGVAFVQANLGRVAARAGRFSEALELLLASRATSEEIGAEAEALETDARIAECHVLNADADAALEVADSALSRAAELGGIAVQEPLLHRVRGHAFMQRRELGLAGTALEQSLAAAEARDAEYEAALTKRAIAQLTSLEGGPLALPLLAESREVLDRLGVEWLPPIPLVDEVVVLEASAT
jgi:class 3 adenylate cyclase/predicted ATPase